MENEAKIKIQNLNVYAEKQQILKALISISRKIRSR